MNMKQKKGIFFSLDALIALIIILLTVLVAYPILKYADYEEMGIPEYWIVDYAALGGRNFIGNPKQPTISVCNLVDEEYQITKFQNSDRLISQTFPDLNLTANQVLQNSIL
jgi:Uma2 family endonuclease